MHGGGNKQILPQNIVHQDCAQRDIQVNVNMCKACHIPVHSNNKTQQRSQFYVFLAVQNSSIGLIVRPLVGWLVRHH